MASTCLNAMSILEEKSMTAANEVSHAPRWAQLPERGTPAMLRLINWIAVRIGRWAARLLLYPITLYFLISAHVARRVSREYLGRVRGRPAHWWHVFHHFHCFAATILDRLYLVKGEFQRSEEHTSELQSQFHLVCRLL